MGFLFGSPGKAPETRFTTLPTLTSGQNQLLDRLVTMVEGSIGHGVPSYPGTYTPGATANQQDIFSLVSQILGGEGPLQQQGVDTMGKLMQPWDKDLAMDYWGKSVKAPMMETWEKDTVPQILEQFAGYDAAGSGPAMEAVSESGRRLNTDIGSILAQTLLSQENLWDTRSMDAAKTGLGYAPSLINMLIPGATMERQIQSEQMQEPYQDWLTEQAWNNPWLQLINPALGTRAFENVAYQTGGKPAQKGIFGDLLGAAATMGAAFLA